MTPESPQPQPPSRASFAGALVALGILVVGLVRLPHYRWQLGPDGTAYIGIARRWLDGQWHDAIATHWSPLFSWLITAVMACGADGLLAAKIILAVVAALTVFPLWTLLGRVTNRAPLQIALAVAAAPLLLLWSVVELTPDTLVVLLVLAYLAVLSSPRFLDDPRRQIAAGVLGGLGFLAKTYQLPFLALHFGVYCALSWRRPGMLRAFAFTVTAFVVVAAPWIAALSARHGAVTIGTAPTYNVGFVGPNNTTHPVLDQGLLEPPPGALSAWEDPSTMTFPPWPAAAESVAHVAHLVAENTGKLVVIVAQMSWLAIPAIIAALALAFDRKRAGPQQHNARFILATIALYPLGLLPLLVLNRYVWIIGPLAIVLTGFVLDAALAWRPMRSLRVLAAAVCLALAAPALRSWLGHADGQVGVHRAAQALTHVDVDWRHARVASLDDWYRGIYLCFHLNCGAYLGRPRTPQNAPDVLAQLENARVDVVLTWKLPFDEAALTGFRRVDVKSPPRSAPAIFVRAAP